MFINVVSCIIFSLLIKPDLAQPALKSYVDEPLFRVIYFMKERIGLDGKKFTKNLVGYKFGLMSIIGQGKYKNKRHFWICKCECGNVRESQRADIFRGVVKSCGCYKKNRLTTHGKTNTPLYSRWEGIRARCYNPHANGYKYYGAKGIAMCDEWKSDFMAFYDWCMANGYEKQLDIDRIDSRGNYEPSNCRFVTKKENARKTLAVKLNQKLADEIMTLIKNKVSCKEIAKLYGISYSTVYLIKRKKIWV